MTGAQASRLHERRFDAKKRREREIVEQPARYAASGVASGTLALQSGDDLLAPDVVPEILLL